MDSQANFADVINNFPGLPPFPDDVPTAPLLRLSLGKLLARDSAELERLYEASVDIGFFYLDLQDSDHGISLLSDADGLFQVGERLFGLFELSLEEKKKYDFSSQNSYFGYKGQGVAVVDKQGNLDRNEFYNVSPLSYARIDKFSPELGRTKTSLRFPKTTSWASAIRFQRQEFCTKAGI